MPEKLRDDCPHLTDPCHCDGVDSVLADQHVGASELSRKPKCICGTGVPADGPPVLRDCPVHQRVALVFEKQSVADSAPPAQTTPTNEHAMTLAEKSKLVMNLSFAKGYLRSWAEDDPKLPGVAETRNKIIESLEIVKRLSESYAGAQTGVLTPEQFEESNEWLDRVYMLSQQQLKERHVRYWLAAAYAEYRLRAGQEEK